MFILNSIAVILVAVVSTSAHPISLTNITKRYEINCKGSGKCGMSDFGDFCMGKIHGALKYAIEKGFGDTRYGDGGKSTYSDSKLLCTSIQRSRRLIISPDWWITASFDHQLQSFNDFFKPISY